MGTKSGVCDRIKCKPTRRWSRFYYASIFSFTLFRKYFVVRLVMKVFSYALFYEDSFLRVLKKMTDKQCHGPPAIGDASIARHVEKGARQWTRAKIK